LTQTTHSAIVLLHKEYIMIKNLFKTLKEIFNEPINEPIKEPIKEPEPKVEKVDDSPYKIFNPIFDPKKNDFGRVVDLYNKIESFGRKCKDDDGELLEVEEKIPERYWGLKFSPTFWDMANNYRAVLDKEDNFWEKKAKRDHIDDMLCEPTFYKKYIGEVLAVVTAGGPYFIYEHETYEIDTKFIGTSDEIKNHFDTIRKTHDIVYYYTYRGEIKHGGELIFKVRYVKLDKQTT